MPSACFLATTASRPRPLLRPLWLLGGAARLEELAAPALVHAHVAGGAAAGKVEAVALRLGDHLAAFAAPTARAVTINTELLGKLRARRLDVTPVAKHRVRRGRDGDLVQRSLLDERAVDHLDETRGSSGSPSSRMRSRTAVTRSCVWWPTGQMPCPMQHASISRSRSRQSATATAIVLRASASARRSRPTRCSSAAEAASWQTARHQRPMAARALSSSSSGPKSRTWLRISRSRSMCAFAEIGSRCRATRRRWRDRPRAAPSSANRARSRGRSAAARKYFGAASWDGLRFSGLPAGAGAQPRAHR